MTWIFEQCTDTAECVRNTTFLVLSMITFALSFYSTIKSYRIQKKITFQILPLAINSIASFAILCLYTQLEIFNTRLILLLIEMYTYFLIAYGYLFGVMRKKTSYNDALRKLNIGFIIVTTIAILTIIVLSTLAAVGTLRCTQDQGVGSLTIIGIQIPLLVIIFVFTHKSKQVLQRSINRRNDSVESHLYQIEDSYIKLKFQQNNLIRFAFTASLILHLVQFFIYFIADEAIICDQNTNQLIINNSIQQILLVLQNFSELFPHLILPFIFWYMPNQITKSQQTICLLRQSQNSSAFHKSRMGNSTIMRDQMKKQSIIRKRMSPDRRKQSQADLK